jgi:hypothetical protein
LEVRSGQPERTATSSPAVTGQRRRVYGLLRFGYLECFNPLDHSPSEAGLQQILVRTANSCAHC